MDPRFSLRRTLPLLLIWLLACWPATPAGQRNLDLSKLELLATDGFTGMQEAQDSQSADLQTGSQDPDPLFPVPEHRKWGYMDRTGKLVLAATYSHAYPFTEGIARVQPFEVMAGKAMRFQFIDKNGRVLPNSQIYSYAEAFSEGLACVAFPGERVFSYIDSTGKRVITADQFAGPFRSGFAAVGDGHKYGYIDKLGKPVIPLQFDRNQSFHEGLAPVMVGKKWGFIDATGKMIIPPTYELAVPPYEGLAAVKLDGKWGYIDKAGQMVIPPQFAVAFGFRDGRAQVKLDGKWGYLDTAGRMVIPAKFEKAAEHTEGMAPVKLEGKWGFVNTAGDMVIAPQFDYVSNFANGLAAVSLGKKVGYIDKTESTFGRQQIDAPRYNRSPSTTHCQS